MTVTTLPKFNPSNDPRVKAIKDKTEELIRYVEGLNDVDDRCKALAMTNYEVAAMWAVKSLFVPAMPDRERLTGADKGRTTALG